MKERTRREAQEARDPLSHWPVLLRRGPLLIALLYAMVGVLWILSSDYWAETLVSNPDLLGVIQTWKGITFIGVTALALYVAMRSLYHAIAVINRKVEERETRFSEMAQYIPEVFWIWDPSREKLSYVSPAFETIWGESVDSILDDPNLWLNSIHPQDRKRVLEGLRYSRTHYQTISQQYRIQRADGAWRWVQERTYPICCENNSLERLIGVVEDITEQRYQQEALHEAAHYDRLTGLPNRYYFHERLEQQCHDSMANHGQFALLLIDLDRFKNINDSLGHSAGDELLRQVSRRLHLVMEQRGFIARLGGDEFAILLSRKRDCENREALIRELIDSLSRPYRIQDESSFMTLSIGVALFPADGSDVENLMRSVDVAMYSAKRSGRNQWCYFHQSQDESSPERLRLEADIHQAVKRQEFELHYQAQFSACGRRMNGTECLLRWQHPERGMVSPGEFIPLLEETGLIAEVGIFVIEQACRSIRGWREQGLPEDFSVAVNISARQLSDEYLLSETERLMEAYDVPPGMLELELTETSLMEEPTHARRLFEGLRAIGVRIAIDDFGTGYSSLNYLREFAPDILKIDKSFVDPIVESTRDRDLVAGIIQLAHTLRIKVVGEGIEEEAQRAILEEVGCDWIQGYLLARPQPITEFEQLMVDYGVIQGDTVQTSP
ncbi:PAS domain S-box-containing protein/diguanylate cyclase (GGDEF)-like protein [Halospina denitrificans]|uniref:PAS domain S-box-containing protein/diguanylate cyclase (GGDEF)-like protein n=1 Tax=Halospina denitrificans TaxID=332522 RepID=A0A4R7K0U1_9GAMM|nr:GGDEF domain-containing phosphodiesterase [Halospina denitrificans]TDT44175.1 PAS domain S-box-containing protein/diguanylate cyclase (GGDEF)-like protein [Halospina denitrificans]